MAVVTNISTHWTECHAPRRTKPATAALGVSLPPRGNPGPPRSRPNVMYAPKNKQLCASVGVIARATVEATVEAQEYELQIIAVLSSFSALPVERLHNIIKFTASEPKLTLSVSELDAFCGVLVHQGILARDARGWLSLRHDPSSEHQDEDTSFNATNKTSITTTNTHAGNGNSNGNGLTHATANGSASTNKEGIRTASPVPVSVRVPTPQPSTAGYPPHLRDFAPYHRQILGLVGNFNSMPLERLTSVLKLTMISPKFNKSQQELYHFMEWLVAQGEVVQDEETGWYSYHESGVAPPSPPAPVKPSIYKATPAATTAVAPAPARPVAKPSTAPAPVRAPEPTPAAAPRQQPAAARATVAPSAARAAAPAPARAASPVAAVVPVPMATPMAAHAEVVVENPRTPSPEPVKATTAAAVVPTATAPAVPASASAPAPAPASGENVPFWMPADPRARMPSPTPQRPLAPASPPPAAASVAHPEQNSDLTSSLITAVALSAFLTFAYVRQSSYANMIHGSESPNVGYEFNKSNK